LEGIDYTRLCLAAQDAEKLQQEFPQAGGYFPWRPSRAESLDHAHEVIERFIRFAFAGHGGNNAA
jgi:hypothetical protein